MAAVNPQGSETYWFNGLPAEHLAKTTPIDEGIETYWFNGLPGESLYPIAVLGTTWPGYQSPFGWQ